MYLNLEHLPIWKPPKSSPEHLETSKPSNKSWASNTSRTSESFTSQNPLYRPHTSGTSATCNTCRPFILRPEPYNTSRTSKTFQYFANLGTWNPRRERPELPWPAQATPEPIMLKYLLLHGNMQMLAPDYDPESLNCTSTLVTAANGRWCWTHFWNKGISWFVTSACQHAQA